MLSITMLLLECTLVLLIAHSPSTAFLLSSSSAGLVVAPLAKRSISTFGVAPTANNTRSNRKNTLFLSSFDDQDNDEDDDEPGKMKVSEIKAELKLRGVSIIDCFDKESLVARLQEARSSGKADPEILDRFNKKKLEDTFKGVGSAVDDTISDEHINAALSSEGKLPGGLAPDQLKKLVSNPELMIMLQSVKMQEVMKLMMASGPEALQKAIEDDEEIKQLVKKLNEVMAGTL